MKKRKTKLRIKPVKAYALVDTLTREVCAGWVYAEKRVLIEELKTAGIYRRAHLAIKRVKISVFQPKRRARNVKA